MARQHKVLPLARRVTVSNPGKIKQIVSRELIKVTIGYLHYFLKKYWPEEVTKLRLITIVYPPRLSSHISPINEK